jgi:hypothetical protein
MREIYIIIICNNFIIFFTLILTISSIFVFRKRKRATDNMYDYVAMYQNSLMEEVEDIDTTSAIFPSSKKKLLEINHHNNNNPTTTRYYNTTIIQVIIIFLITTILYFNIVQNLSNRTWDQERILGMFDNIILPPSSLLIMIYILLFYCTNN